MVPVVQRCQRAPQARPPVRLADAEIPLDLRAVEHGIDQPTELPIASCSLSEPELIEIGPEACDGHVSSSVYFASIARARNRAFVEAYCRRYPQAGPTSADAESSYLAVHLLARAVRTAGSSELAAVRDALPSITMNAPQGRVQIDAANRHCYLTPRIGLSNKAAGFDLLYEAAQPIKPDPYLVHHDIETWKTAGAAKLRVVK